MSDIKKIATRESYGEALVELGKEHENLIVLDADLAGAIKYNQKDIRNILERSSARETASRVAVGAFCQDILNRLTLPVYFHKRQQPHPLSSVRCRRHIWLL